MSDVESGLLSSPLVESELLGDKPFPDGSVRLLRSPDASR